MSTTTIHHAYNEVVATHYDLDPQGVIGNALDRGLAQIRQEGLVGETNGFRVLDIGMGTGLFLGKLHGEIGDRLIASGVDLSDNMLEYARRRIPGLNAIAGDATDLDAHFPGEEFDCICTHFVTGFVSMRVLAPQIARHLRPGGCWSLIGGTRAAYPALQAKGDSKFLRWLSGAGSRTMDDAVLNPADMQEVRKVLGEFGFQVRRSETFEPNLSFPDFDTFMEFAYKGGWLTPLIESMGLHKAGPLKRWLINRLAFPVEDRHNIVIALLRKQ
ncbi:MAG: class I SAM-dependent methyltransferase [Isosphaeraceae bacterium]